MLKVAQIIRANVFDVDGGKPDGLDLGCRAAGEDQCRDNGVTEQGGK